MKFTMFQVDAFASTVFTGNPAAVIPLDEWLPDKVMQQVAMENQLSETCFFVPEGESFRLRWFTPVSEVNLCGHATMAAAHVLFTELAFPGETVAFETRSGTLTVERVEQSYRMNFPLDTPVAAPDQVESLSAALGAKVEECLRGREDLVAVLSSEEEVQELDPNLGAVASLEGRGVLVTAPGDQHDFVSRCFFPRFGIDEDPVTGSAHTTLAPYWKERLGRNPLRAAQISARGGEVRCHLSGDRISLDGDAVTFLRGEIFL